MSFDGISSCSNRGNGVGGIARTCGLPILPFLSSPEVVTANTTFRIRNINKKKRAHLLLSARGLRLLVTLVILWRDGGLEGRGSPAL